MARSVEGVRARRVDGWRILNVFAFPLFALSLACSLDRWWWPFEDLAAFRVQILLVVLPVATAYAFGRRGRSAALGGLCLGLHALVLWPLAWGGERVEPGPDRMRLVLWNVHRANPDRAAAIEFLRRVEGDAIVLLEVDRGWMHDLEPLRETHPHVEAEPQEDDFGLAVFSSRPLLDGRVVYFGDSPVPSIVVRIGSLTLVATHPLPPTREENVRLRNGQMEAIARRLREVEGPVVLSGDLNMTPWSPVFRRFLVESGLRDTGAGRGWQPTWPVGLPQCRIPIDHVLVSREIAVLDRRVGEGAGSDHDPVVVELALTPSPGSGMLPR